MVVGVLDSAGESDRCMGTLDTQFLGLASAEGVGL